MDKKLGILINDTSSEYHIGCDTVIYNIKRLCELNGIQITQTFTRRDVRVPNKCDQAIKDCDIVIINGEGSLHDAYGRNFLQPLLNMIPDGKKTILINSLWYNMGKIEGIEKLKLITLRETDSYIRFRKDYPNYKYTVKIVPDIIFALPLSLTNIGYGDSVYGNKTNMLNCHGNFFPLDYRRQSTPGKSIELKADNVYAYLKWLKSLDLYITGRFHGVCLSAMAGTPFLALPSNAGKIEAILKDMGCQDLLINSVEEKDQKIQVAQNLAPLAYEYAQKAREEITHLFKIIRRITYE